MDSMDVERRRAVLRRLVMKDPPTGSLGDAGTVSLVCLRRHGVVVQIRKLGGLMRLVLHKAAMRTGAAMHKAAMRKAAMRTGACRCRGAAC